MGCQDHRVRGDLLTGAQDEDVVEHDVTGCDLVLGSLSEHESAGDVHQRQSVERTFRPELLDAADDRVGERRQPEERVLPAADEEQYEEAGEHDPVEQREHVRTDDAPGTSARIRCEGVRGSGRDAVCDLRGREAGRDRCGGVHRLQYRWRRPLP